MIVRSYRSSDAAAIDEIYERCGHGHDRPNLDKVIGAVVIEADGVIIGFGALEAIPEVSLIMDIEVSYRYKVEALKEIADALLLILKLNNFKSVYAFSARDGFDKVLQRHFDFEPCVPILRREV